MAWRGRAAVVVAAAAVVGVAAWHRAGAAREAVPVAPEVAVVDPSVPEAKLLNGVLYVDERRRSGEPVGFAHVPRERPPGLTDVTPDLSGGGDSARTDSYRLTLGGSRVFVFVEFAARPTATCEDTRGMTHAVCVRTAELPEPGVRYVTVYLTAGSAAVLADAGQVRRFWAGVDLVPVGEAAWFTDLVTRARAAVPR
jgi:hypothetical protein